VCFIVLHNSQDHLRIGTHDLDHPVSCQCKKHRQLVPSSVIAIAVDGEHLTCSGFSLGETIHLENFKFIADFFGGMSFTPRRGDESAAFLGSTHSGTSTPRQAMIEDSTEEFLTASSGEGSFGLPSPRRRSAGASPALVTTTPWLTDILNITTAQQANNSLQRQTKAFISSLWDTS
jgi:hypothetical protein